MTLQQAAKPLFLIALLLAAFYALTHEGKFAMPSMPGAKASSLVIDDAWSRATPKGASVAAGYLTINNKGAAPDRLLGGASSVGRVEIHEMKTVSGIMQMRRLRNLSIPAGGTVELKPGGFHLMFLNLKAPLAEGQDFKTTLKFEKAGAVEVNFHVRPLGKEHAP
jgi:copper(I)-binding protein